ncbi:hypothetical protein J2X06_003446 [Lysobacter niastensis]|uniref:DUF4376 domain-containing protein n=1 Tax=Lysobacter niastensis TaxID=380629 RepID=A0ABU1WF43_9GAMM|nr:hypothetical protein [Lysobacter niastensis]MDR7136220.1 hypothetical protein [Lysobacter niastensis]
MQFAGWETVALSSEPFELDPQGRTLTSKDQMKALGISNACVVLKANYPLGPQAQMDRDFESLLQGAKVSALLTADNGQEYQLDSVGQAWAMHGAITSSEELSACVSCACESKIPDGTVIKSVHIKSDKPLPVLGAYWQSMPKLDGPEG